jgi:hypothetical protein
MEITANTRLGALPAVATKYSVEVLKEHIASIF